MRTYLSSQIFSRSIAASNFVGIIPIFLFGSTDGGIFADWEETLIYSCMQQIIWTGMVIIKDDKIVAGASSYIR